MDNIKFHPSLRDQDHEDILERVEKIGLDIIDYSKTYSINKTYCKILDMSSELYEPCFAGKPLLSGWKGFVMLYLQKGFAFYRTSPIEICYKNKDKFIVETINSCYELTEVG
jgi:hypothetical protein